MKLRKYTLEQLKEAVRTTTSFRQALSKLGIAECGGNYATIQKAVKLFDIDVSHYTGCGWNKGKKFPRKRKLSAYLGNKYKITSHKLRKRLIEEGIFEHRCCHCNLTRWLDFPIPLELDHIDGNHENNALKNLRLLCPNCHSLTPTYRGKNKSSKA